MDDNAHRENGRQKPPQGQWLMQHQPSMKQIMALMAERDAAIQERNLALSEKKSALAERDVAILQRDSAISERNNAIIERDNAIAALQYRENNNTTLTNNANLQSCPPGCQISRGVKHIHHPQTQHHEPHHHHLMEVPYNNNNSISGSSKDCLIADSPEPSKPTRGSKRAKEPKPSKRNSKSLKRVVVKNETEDLKGGGMFGKNLQEQQHQLGSGSEDSCNNNKRGQVVSGWKDQDLGLNQVVFDETTMPVPVCSCTGVLRPCYKWGNGGWQSSCCTTNLSMYPLPAVPNKRHARVGGRKMSGSAFNKLLSRLAAEGHDLSNPVDLKEHWAKHGTNRYITIK